MRCITLTDRVVSKGMAVKTDNVANEIKAEIEAILSFELSAYEQQRLKNGCNLHPEFADRPAVQLEDILLEAVRLHQMLRLKGQ
jgi:hypothetical protein